MAPPAVRLRDAILRHLRQGSDSISGVARALSHLEGSPVHRLTIAGHLAAMTEEGILREVERPPSKHYQVEDDKAPQTVHERIGAVVGTLDVPAPDRAATAIGLANQLFGRPIFLAELHACGFQSPGRGAESVDASDEQRRAFRHLFRHDGPHPLDIPRGDALLQALPAAVRPAVLQEGLRRLALDASNATELESPAWSQAQQQSRLDLGGPA